MRLASNRQREEAILSIFQNKYGLVGEFKHADSPDFVGSYNDDILGVEVTEIYSDEKEYGKTLLEHEVAKKRIVHRACERATEFGLPPLLVDVIFSGNIPDDKEPYLTESLFVIVKNNWPTSESQVCLNGFESDLPEGLWAILIYNMWGLKKHIWNWGEAGDVETHFSKQLQRIIDNKASRISEYLKKCNECWLVIAAIGDRPSSFYEFEREMERSCYKSPFEKVFFLEVISQTLKELRKTTDSQ